ncbi:hypothetical protein [Anthocerotibacter panamensis]|uniref:hypothetical protein n=1 Tax=Anthocerotibacter panamensis TaxID=2857077 RepID=UPI001C407495|nr:hypothetical protein [Anthocerotibacter panamensis]
MKPADCVHVQVSTVSTDYTPIDCTCYDQLLDLATLCTPCDIIYRDRQGQEVVAHGIITDVYTKQKEEFLTLSNGVVIRLDHLVRVVGRNRF